MDFITYHYKKKGMLRDQKPLLPGIVNGDHAYCSSDDPNARLHEDQDTDKTAALTLEYMTRMDKWPSKVVYHLNQTLVSSRMVNASINDALGVLISIRRWIQRGLAAAIIIFVADLIMDSMYLWKWWG